MIRKTVEGREFESQMIGELHFDQTPKEGSFNPVTSDGVAKAIDKAKDDMQEKIDEVTLDPSAVALGNVHLLDEVTEFPADGSILVDSETNGPANMSKDTLLELTAQNALAGNVAPEFVPNSTTTIAGLPYVYNGSLYIAKEAYQGPWDGSKFSQMPISEKLVENEKLTKFGILSNFDLNDKSVWLFGGYDTYTGEYSFEYTNRLCTKKYYFTDDSYADLTLETGVNAEVVLYGWASDGSFVAARRVDNIVQNTIGDFKALNPTAVVFAFSLVNISGVTVSVDNLAGIGIFDDTLVGLKTPLDQYFDGKYKRVENAVNNNIDLNDKRHWLFGGYDTVTGAFSSAYSNRLCTGFLPLTPNSYFKKTNVAGVTSNVTMYGRDSDGNYLGMVVTEHVAEYLEAHPTATTFAISLVNISGTTTSVDNLSNICSFVCNVVSVKSALLDSFEANVPRIESLTASAVDLNDKAYWRFGGYNTSTGAYDNGFSDRLCTEYLNFTDKTVFTKTNKNGVSSTIVIYGKDSSGGYLGKKSTTSIADYLSSYPTATKFAVSLISISGTATSVDNLNNICEWSAGSFVYCENNDYIRQANTSYAIRHNVYRKFPLKKLNVHTKKPTIAFTFDGNYAGNTEFYKLFKSKGIRCGFAVIASSDMLEDLLNMYLEWQNEGFEILIHSPAGKIINTENFPTYQDVYSAYYQAKRSLVNHGAILQGFVAPYSTVEPTYKSFVGQLFAYGSLTSSLAYNTANTSVIELNRCSMEGNELADIKDLIDDAITNNGMIIFYGHANNIGTYWTMEKLEEIVDYVLAKEAADLCYVDSPVNAVSYYYDVN